MKNPSPPTSLEHPEALLLPYVEDVIGPSERAGVEEHLNSCKECASRVEELRRTITDLKGNKEAFCPEPWELHDFARSGEDPHGIISAHIEKCPACSEDLSAWKRSAVEERMPAELWSRLREQLPGAAQEQIRSERPKWGQLVLEKLARFWKAPALAAGLAAAVLLVVIVFQPSQEPIVPIPKSLPKKTAFVVLLKDFKDPGLQKQIESLYETLNTSTELKNRYSIVSPAETLEVIESGKAPLDDRSAMIEGLRKNLNVSLILSSTVFPRGDKLNVRVDLIDTISGKTLQTKTEEKIEKTEAVARVRSELLSVLLSAIEQR